MADPQIVTTLRTKQAELQDAIDYLEGKLSEARSDLGHVNAVLRLYEVDGTRLIAADTRSEGMWPGIRSGPCSGGYEAPLAPRGRYLCRSHPWAIE